MSVNKGCIAYSFFGSQAKYLDGIKHTIDLLFSDSSQYSGSTSFSIYIFSDCFSEPFLRSSLPLHPSVKVIVVDSGCHFFSIKRLWRYCVLHRKELNDFDFCLFRDSDSLFMPSEQELIDLWLESEFPFCIIRGAGLHTWPILAGLFGVKRSDYYRLKALMSMPPRLFDLLPDIYNKDQLLLAFFVYPSIAKISLVFTALWYYRGEFVIPLRNLEYGFPGGYFSDPESPSLCRVSFLYESTENQSPLCLAPPIPLAFFFKFSIRFFSVWKAMLLLRYHFARFKR